MILLMFRGYGRGVKKWWSYPYCLILCIVITHFFYQQKNPYIPYQLPYLFTQNYLIHKICVSPSHLMHTRYASPSHSKIFWSEISLLPQQIFCPPSRWYFATHPKHYLFLNNDGAKFCYPINQREISRTR